MSELLTIARDELEHLEQRARKLSQEKSYLQLVNSLMNRVGAASGLEDTVDCMLRNIMDVVGGATIVLYYWIDSDIFSVDVFGAKSRLERIEDELTQRVVVSHEAVEFEHPFADTKLTTTDFTKAHTWVYPLMVGSELVGVFKMESLQIGMEELRQHLPTFFNFAAHVLKNEIQGHNRLNQAYHELQLAYDELQRTQSRLLQQDKMASIGQLAAGVAHEINNPMGFIISNLGSLGKYVEKVTAYLDSNKKLFADCNAAIWELLTQERKKYKIDHICKDLPDLISESLEGAQRVRKIVQELKSFSRIDSAEYDYADLNEGLESTLSIVWNELKYKATVEKEYGQLPRVLCNLGQLNQVFMNILVNAAQSIPVQGTIRIKTWSDGTLVRIDISDTGAGMDEETARRIFEPFFTTKEVGQGTGLGLSIAYDIVVNKHGGQIEVASEIGKGSSFTITLPVRRTADSTSA